MAIRNVQRVSLGNGVSGFSFDVTPSSSNVATAASSIDPTKTETTAPFEDTGKWAAFEEEILESLKEKYKK